MSSIADIEYELWKARRNAMLYATVWRFLFKVWYYLWAPIVIIVLTSANGASGFLLALLIVGGWYGFRVYQFNSGMKAYFTKRNATMKKMGVGHWPKFDECIGDVASFFSIGMKQDLIEVVVLLDYPRPVALGTFEYLSTPMPAMARLLQFLLAEKLTVPIKEAADRELDAMQREAENEAESDAENQATAAQRTDETSS